MNIKPALGTGDLLILKMKQLSHNFNIEKINISLNLLELYRKYPDQSLNFIKKLLILLFPDTSININNDFDIPFEYNFDYLNEYNITNTYLYDYLNKNINIEYKNYIVFHTKVRLDGLMDKFINHDIQKLDIFFNNFKTDKLIIIFGEKNIEDCLEKTHHNIISIYENLLQLNKNNKVIDLTQNELYSGNTNFNNFLKDIEIINKADYNITFTIGGPYNLCQAFSKNNICYISNFQHQVIDDYIRINNNSYRDIDKFIDKINNI